MCFLNACSPICFAHPAAIPFPALVSVPCRCRGMIATEKYDRKHNTKRKETDDAVSACLPFPKNATLKLGLRNGEEKVTKEKIKRHC